jgi:hypothetical protein
MQVQTQPLAFASIITGVAAVPLASCADGCAAHALHSDSSMPPDRGTTAAQAAQAGVFVPDALRTAPSSMAALSAGGLRAQVADPSALQQVEAQCMEHAEQQHGTGAPGLATLLASQTSLGAKRMAAGTDMAADKLREARRARGTAATACNQRTEAMAPRHAMHCAPEQHTGGYTGAYAPSTSCAVCDTVHSQPGAKGPESDGPLQQLTAQQAGHGDAEHGDRLDRRQRPLHSPQPSFPGHLTQRPGTVPRLDSPVQSAHNALPSPQRWHSDADRLQRCDSQSELQFGSFLGADGREGALTAPGEQSPLLRGAGPALGVAACVRAMFPCQAASEPQDSVGEVGDQWQAPEAHRASHEGPGPSPGTHGSAGQPTPFLVLAGLAEQVTCQKRAARTGLLHAQPDCTAHAPSLWLPAPGHAKPAHRRSGADIVQMLHTGGQPAPRKPAGAPPCSAAVVERLVPAHRLEQEAAHDERAARRNAVRLPAQGSARRRKRPPHEQPQPSECPSPQSTQQARRQPSAGPGTAGLLQALPGTIDAGTRRAATPAPTVAPSPAAPDPAGAAVDGTASPVQLSDATPDSRSGAPAAICSSSADDDSGGDDHDGYDTGCELPQHSKLNARTLRLVRSVFEQLSSEEDGSSDYRPSKRERDTTLLDVPGGGAVRAAGVAAAARELDACLDDLLPKTVMGSFSKLGVPCLVRGSDWVRFIASATRRAPSCLLAVAQGVPELQSTCRMYSRITQAQKPCKCGAMHVWWAAVQVITFVRADLGYAGVAGVWAGG